jgi:hypothetical protein
MTEAQHDGTEPAADDSGQQPAATGDGAQQQRDDGRPDDAKELRTTLAAERKARVGLEKQLAELQKKSMSDADKAIADAREEGRTEARTEASRRIAAVEFRAAAHGKLADPDAALELLDLGRLVGDDGEPDRDAIKAVIDRLAPVSAPSPKVPSGPRDTVPDTDFIRASLAARRG